jgi:hypothetical protein
MKKQKSVLRITLFSIFMLGVASDLSAQNGLTTKEAKFLIVVETTNNPVKLTCKEGCAWKELSFPLALNNLQPIDQNGMASMKSHKATEDSTLSSFYFTITKTKDGLSFKGLEGTAWKDLSFSCSKNKCHQPINQNGMTTLNLNHH